MPNPIRSMTGYARTRRVLNEGEIVVSLRAVNHRGLDLHFFLPVELTPYEPALRKTLSANVSRGHVEIRAHLTRNGGGSSLRINQPMLAGWIRAFREAAAAHGLSAEPDLNVALRIPGIMADPALEEIGEEVGEALSGAAQECLDLLNRSRAKEGQETAAAIRAHVARIREAADTMEAIRGGVQAALHERMQERLAELLRGASLDPARLSQEAALLADRSDVSEEITRLRIHTSQLSDLLAAGGEVGKRTEFLAQEMHREANTILSKSNAAGEPGRRIAELALSVKSEVEKIREQSLNLE